MELDVLEAADDEGLCAPFHHCQQRQPVQGQQLGEPGDLEASVREEQTP